MKYFTFVLSAVFAIMFTASLSLALCEKSIKKGKEIFNSPEKLGSSAGISCAKCHPDGKGLKGVAKKKKYEDDAELAKIINMCIEKPTKGKKLAADSEEMKYLMYYVRSIGCDSKGSDSKGTEHKGSEHKGNEHKGSGTY